MLGAGLLAKKAVELGLTTKSYIKTSLSPGSAVVTYYLEESGVKKYLEQLGLVRVFSSKAYWKEFSIPDVSFHLSLSIDT